MATAISAQTYVSPSLQKKKEKKKKNTQCITPAEYSIKLHPLRVGCQIGWNLNHLPSETGV